MASPFRDGILEGKVAFVAGGTSRINLGIATRFAELGARVAVLGRNPEKAASAAAGIGRGAIGLTADVRDYGAIRAAMEEVRSRLLPDDAPTERADDAGGPGASADEAPSEASDEAADEASDEAADAR